MKKEHAFLGGGILIIILLIWISTQLDEKKRLKEENQALKEDKLRLVREYLKVAKEIPSEIKSQIERLVTEYENLDSEVAKELLNVLNLIEQKMEPEAIAKLVLVIENLLKDKYAKQILAGKYSTQENFLKEKKKIKLFKVIEFAKSDKFFSLHEYNLMILLKDFRNKSCHELAVKIGKNWRTIAFLTGIEIVFKLKGQKTI